MPIPCRPRRRASARASATIASISCWATITASPARRISSTRAERWFADHGLKVQRNQPYAGGFTTQRYGRPGLNRHALQIEINRSLYMDEGRHQKLANAAAIERIMTGFLEEIAGQALAVLLPRPLAAE